MRVERRAGAPRLIDWTGERCVPWTPDVQVAYEHFHRYLWAARLVAGRRVLDVGSGEGFGSAILAGSAASVLGIDIDPTTVDHARLNYSADNLSFRTGSALELDDLEDGSFGAVVAFEVIEHLTDHARMLDGIRRVLADDGLFIVSTPDRRMYTDAMGQDNPFHQLELDEGELRSLLDARFAHVRLWGQRAITGSRLGALDDVDGDKAGLSVSLERASDGWRVAGEPAPIHLVAVASPVPIEPVGSESFLADYGLGLMRAAEARASAAQQAQRAAPADREAERARLAAELDPLFAQLGARERELREAAEAAARAEQAHAAGLKRLRTIDQSVTWRLFERVRGRLYGSLGGRMSPPARAFQWSLRIVGRRLAPAPPPPPPAPSEPVLHPIRFPRVEHPVASIIVPVHGRPDLTEKCLRSLAERTDGPSFEVIVIDDLAPEHAPVWDALENAHVIHNDENLGYLRSNNRAAKDARGDFLVLLNNDTEVREGWLRALVTRAESAPDVGVVVPKLLFMDGAMQEAGAIIFDDGSGWNYGRGLDPDKPELNYAREVDYGSGACLLVRADLWRRVGGFDERYVPMYYEDADLCFAARDAGYSVVFEPTAAVFHVEGATAGTDLQSGSKRFQEINQAKFRDKWSARLEAEQLPPSPSLVRRASDRNRGPHVLVIDHRVPSPDRDAGSVRMWELLTALLELGCRVTFLPDTLQRWEPYSAELQRMGVEVLYGSLSIAEEVATIGANMALAIVSRPQVAPRYLHTIREFSPTATIVFDTVDLHYVREQRRAALDGGVVAGAAESWREIELALVRVADVTTVATQPEKEELYKQVPDSEVVVLPMAHPLAQRVAPPAGRSGLLFVGSFEHPPNADAAVWLVNSIMPHVWRELGEVTLRIVGADPPPEVIALGRPGVEVTGWVEDLGPLFASTRVMLAPLRFGAGMKGKVTQSLANGLPVVTTSIGAEGIDGQDGRVMLIADDAEGFAERVVRAHVDDGLWSKLSAAGQELVERSCSPTTMRERLGKLLAHARAREDEARSPQIL